MADNNSNTRNSSNTTITNATAQVSPRPPLQQVAQVIWVWNLRARPNLCGVGGARWHGQRGRPDAWRPAAGAWWPGCDSHACLRHQVPGSPQPHPAPSPGGGGLRQPPRAGTTASPRCVRLWIHHPQRSAACGGGIGGLWWPSICSGAPCGCVGDLFLVFLLPSASASMAFPPSCTPPPPPNLGDLKKKQFYYKLFYCFLFVCFLVVKRESFVRSERSFASGYFSVKRKIGMKALRLWKESTIWTFKSSLQLTDSLLTSACHF